MGKIPGVQFQNAEFHRSRKIQLIFNKGHRIMSHMAKELGIYQGDQSKILEYEETKRIGDG